MSEEPQPKQPEETGIKPEASGEGLKHIEPKIDLLSQQPPHRKVLLQTAEHLLMDEGLDQEIVQLDDQKLIALLHNRFQKQLENHFRESGLLAEIKALPINEQLSPSHVPLDEQALHLIARKSDGVHGWLDMLPNLRNQIEGAGLNCTLGSAMLHLALDELGLKEVRTVLRRGHHVVLRELDNGSIKLYDPTSSTTVNEQTVGYFREFTPDQIRSRRQVDEGSARSGYSFILTSDTEDTIGGFYATKGKKEISEAFYAYDPSTKLDLAIALGNLSEVKDDAEKARNAGQKPLFDDDSYKTALLAFVSENNETPISDEDIEELTRQNTQTIKELLQAARKAFDGEAKAPNPFDYLQGDKLEPKSQLKNIPNPKNHAGASKRYDQARKLCNQFPELEELDFKDIKAAFHLFDGHDYLQESPLELSPSLDRAREIMGEKQILGPDKVTLVFGVELSAAEIPRIPYTEEQLRQAKENGELLILRIDKTNDGKPLTLRNLRSIRQAQGKSLFTGKELTDSKFGDEDFWAKGEDFLDHKCPKMEWKLVTNKKIDGTELLSFRGQKAFIDRDQERVRRELEDIIPYWREIWGPDFEKGPTDGSIPRAIENMPDIQSLQDIMKELPSNAALPTIAELVYDHLLFFGTTGDLLVRNRTVPTSSKLLPDEENPHIRPWDVSFDEEGHVILHKRRSDRMGRPVKLGHLDTGVPIAYIQH